SLEAAVKIALVGRRNTGKSTFLNALADEERTIVSEVEGTTRDSVDVRFERDGKLLVAIDTAGVRYRGKVKDDLDFYSLTRSERSIRRADVVLHFLDAMTKISLVDKQLAGYVLENYKPAIFVVNKWDLTDGQIATGEYGEYLRRVFPSLDFVPIAFVTAKMARNVHSVVNLAQNLHKQASARVSTGELNRVVRMAVEANPPPMRRNRTGRIYFATQAATQPPTVVLFTNGPELFDNTYRRFLLKTFRDHLPFNDVAIKLYLRTRGGRAAEEAETTEPAEKPAVKPKPAAPAKPSKKKREVGDLWKDV
ncbi:MAG: GTP-binding protein, partial [Gemmataceae bacterium]